MLRSRRSASITLLALPAVLTGLLAGTVLPAAASSVAPPASLVVSDDYVTHTLSGAATACVLATDAGCPDNGQPLREPVLTWAPSAGATSYEVQVSPDSNFTNGIALDQASIPTARFVLPQELHHANYFWRVRAFAGSAASSWVVAGGASPAAFGRAWTVKPVITKVNDASGAANPDASTSDGSMDLEWSPVAGATFYQVQLAARPFPAGDPVQYAAIMDPKNTSNQTLNCYVNHTAFTPYVVQNVRDENQDTLQSGKCEVSDPTTQAFAFAGATTYYARVRAWDTNKDALLTATSSYCAGHQADSLAGGGLSTTAPAVPSVGAECGFWSDQVALTTAAAPTAGTLSPVVLAAPTGCDSGATTASATCPDMPTLRWSGEPNAGSYVVTVSTDPGPAVTATGDTNVIRQYVTQATSLTPQESLNDAQANGGYYYAVEACASDALGCSSPATASAVGRFAVRHPGPALMKPLGAITSAEAPSGNLVRARTVTVQWFHQAGAASYDVQVAGVNDDSYGTVLFSADDVNAPEVTFTGVADGDYRWRVRMKDGSGITRTWSEGQFTVNGVVATLSLGGTSLPLSGALVLRSNRPLTGVSSSTVHLAVAGSSTPLAGTVSATSSTTTWKLTPAAALVAGQSYRLMVASSVKDATAFPAVADPTSHRALALVDAPSTAMQVHSGSWTTHTASGALGGSYQDASAAGASLRTLVFGKSVQVLGCKGPSGGRLTVATSGLTTATVDTYQSFTKCGVVLYSSPALAGNATRTVTMTVTGTKQSASKGTHVSIDAVKVS